MNTKAIIDEVLSIQIQHQRLTDQTIKAIRYCINRLQFDELDTQVNQSLSSMSDDRRGHAELQYRSNVSRVTRIFVDRAKKRKVLNPDSESALVLLEEWQDIKRVQSHLRTWCNLYPCSGENTKLIVFEKNER